MKHEQLAEAMGQISDAHISEASLPTRKFSRPWLGAVAAILAVALLVTALARPKTVQAQGLIAAPVHPEMVQYSENNWDAWRKGQNAQYDQPDHYASGTEHFFRTSIHHLLTTETENAVCSPVNIYLALAMLAEAADGNSRQQLLDLLGSGSIEALRTRAGHMWNAHYCNDGLSTSILANSLWLDTCLQYNEDTVSTLANSYYASVYREDLGSDEANAALRAWVNDQTKGLLEDYAGTLELNRDTILALASTIYYNVQWPEEFREENNYDDVFHAPGGDTQVTYMYKLLTDEGYYRGEDFSAVALSLQDGSKMWLILPDEGYIPADILESGHALDMILGSGDPRENQLYARVRLSVPKFDVASGTDLIPALKELGVTDVFNPETADLSAMIPPSDDAPYVDQATHAARVSIDEKGVTATAHTVIIVDRAAADIEDEIDFVLDRPFLFLIESRDGLPLFSGVVNEP